MLFIFYKKGAYNHIILGTGVVTMAVWGSETNVVVTFWAQ